MAKGEAVFRSDDDCGTGFAKRVRLKQQELIVDARFRRCYPTLHLIACQVLGGPGRAEEVIASCWRIACRNPQRVQDEGEFYSWLLRVLMDEALVLIRESLPAPTRDVLCEPVPSRVFRSNRESEGKGDIGTDVQDRFSQEILMALK